MKRRIGILTGGGDSPSLNAVIRAVTTRAIRGHGWEVVGIRQGFRGLAEASVERLNLARVRDLLPQGGTILGASTNSNPFHYPEIVRGVVEVRDVTERIRTNVAGLQISDLIAVGGDGTMNI